MQENGFNRQRRITHKGDYRSIQKEGRKVVTRHLVFLLSINTKGHPRLGLIVSKKAGNAVRRNRIKRVIRESFRLRNPFDGKGVDIVVIPRASLPKPATLAVVFYEFERMEEKAKKILKL